MTRLTPAFLAFFLSATLLLGLSNSAGAQVRVTVGGMTYDITANLGSFNNVGLSVDLTDTNNAPWYTGVPGGNASAIAFRDAWLAVNDTSAIPPNSELAFAYNATSLPNLDYAGASNIAGTLAASGDALTVDIVDLNTPAGRTLYYATATLVAEVPEINSSALSQMFLVLLVGYLMMLGRRRLRQA